MESEEDQAVPPLEHAASPAIAETEEGQHVLQPIPSLPSPPRQETLNPAPSASLPGGSAPSIPLTDLPRSSVQQQQHQQQTTGNNIQSVEIGSAPPPSSTPSAVVFVNDELRPAEEDKLPPSPHTSDHMDLGETTNNINLPGAISMAATAGTGGAGSETQFEISANPHGGTLQQDQMKPASSVNYSVPLRKTYQAPTNPKMGAQKTAPERLRARFSLEAAAAMTRSSGGSDDSTFEYPYGIGDDRSSMGGTTTRSSFGTVGGGRGSMNPGVSPRKSTQMLRANAHNLVTKVQTTIKHNLMTDTDGQIHVRDTWKHMKTRSWKRYKTSLRWSHSNWSNYFLLIYLALYATFVAVRTAVFHAANADVFILMGLILIIAYALSTRTIGVYQLLWTEFMLGFYVYYLLAPQLTSEKIFPGSITDLLFYCLVITPCVMIISAVVYHYSPYFVYYAKAYTQLGLRVTSQQYIDLLSDDTALEPKAANNPLVSQSIIRDQFAIAHHGDADYYRAVMLVEMKERRRSFLFFKPDEYSSLYVGPLFMGRPHGLGQWIDSSPLGENLFGYFDKGIPVGPFRSNENSSQTRSSFVNMRIVYMDDCDLINPLRRITPVFGVASCECAVSGENLLGWPKAGVIQEPELCVCDMDECTCMDRMLKEFYRHLDDTRRTTNITVAIDDSWTGLEVSGHRPRHRQKIREVRIKLLGDAERDMAPLTEPPDRTSTQMFDTKDLESQVVSGLFNLSEVGSWANQTSPVSPNGESMQTPINPKTNRDNFSSEANRQRIDSRGFRGQAESYDAGIPESNGRSSDPIPPEYTSFDEEAGKSKRVTISAPNPGAATSPTGSKEAKETSPTRSKFLGRPGGDVDLVVDNRWLPVGGQDAVIYVHGFKHTRIDIVRRFGQFLGMANLPPNVKPIMFHWPSGRGNTAYWPAYSSANSDIVAEDFLRMMYSLRNAGIVNVHFMLHSMGARVFFSAWNMIRGLFLEDSMELEELESEVAAKKSSSEDLSLRVAAQLHEALNVDALRRSGTTLDGERKMLVTNVILLNPDYEVSKFREDAPSLQRYCPRITLYVDRRDAALKLGQSCTGRVSLGVLMESIVDVHGVEIDMDIIDTTDLQSNVGGTFHSFWNINRSLIDDIQDLVIQQKRARFRTSRLLRIAYPSIYRFIRTPQHIIEV